MNESFLGGISGGSRGVAHKPPCDWRRSHAIRAKSTLALLLQASRTWVSREDLADCKRRKRLREGRPSAGPRDISCDSHLCFCCPWPFGEAVGR